MKMMSARQPWPVGIAALLVPVLFVGCATSPQPRVITQAQAKSGDNVFTAIASVEHGGSCQVNPCNVLFKTPQGEGDVQVVANGFVIGTFPRGETITLGNYSESVRISMPGTDYGTIFVNIPNSNNP